MRDITISAPAVLKWAAAMIAVEWLRLPGTMRALIWLMLIDYMSGLAAAYNLGQLSSRVGTRGLIRKLMVPLLLLAAHIVEKAAGVELKIESIGSAAFIFNEFISIVENCTRAGAPIPQAWVEKLMIFKRIYSRATPEQIAEISADHARADSFHA